MPAGDLITRPGQVEWSEILFDVAPGDSGVWIPNPRKAQRTGWHPVSRRAVYETEAGATAGKPMWEPMYPAIDGVACDDVDAFMLLRSLMDPFYVTEPSTLVWWSFERDEIISGEALPWRFNPVENDDAEHQPTRFVDVAWLIQRPGEVSGEFGESS